ncbi:MAG: outer membrane protein transport protein [Hyphomicrobiales bacterium]|nr:outer membrane protein transport protein [Hyphomicrobiales bacterium]MDE2115998.1 outer membrane protein transport protein [Hyphomicrobiales bacterium]
MAGTANATDGYFQIGYGTIQQSLAGAGVAHAEDAMALAVNPAGILDIGNQFYVGATLINPTRGYTGTGTGFIAPGDHKSGRPIFGVPAAGYTYQIDGSSAVGIAIYGNGGINTTYKPFVSTAPACPGALGVFCSGKAGVDLEQAFVTVGYAHKFGSLSVGIAPVFAYQQFKAYGLAALAGGSSSPTNFSDNGYATSSGGGVRAGIQWNAAPGFNVGLTGSTPMYMSKFNKYSGLFANQGNFNIPGNIAFGVSYQITPTVTVLADYKRIFYSGVPSVGNASNIALPFGVSGGPGFGWRDVDVFSIGAEWAATSQLVLRAGYSHNTNPVRPRDAALNILAPGVITDHFTAGMSYAISNQMNLDLGGVYSPKHTVSGAVPAAFGGGTVSDYLSGFAVTAGLRYQFASATPGIFKGPKQ